MFSTLSTTLLVTLFLVIIGIISSLRAYSKQAACKVNTSAFTILHSEDTQQCQDILDGFDPTNGETCHKNRLLEARAVPNQRLVETFHIESAFTTIDPDIAKAFQKEIKSVLSYKTNWSAYPMSTDIRRMLNDTATPSVSLVSIVQRLTLRTAIHFVFPGIQFHASHYHKIATDLSTVARLIDVLWQDSKIAKSSTSVIQLQLALFAALYRVFDGTPCAFSLDEKGFPQDRTKNPLRLILPSYETMWRVVLRCFLEVRYKSPTPTMRKSYEAAFLCLTPESSRAHPDKKTVATPENFTKENGLARCIVKESLRLYPPTKRIYRAVVCDAGLSIFATLFRSPRANRIHAVDIEALHRRSDVWGADATSFRPERWSSMEKDPAEFMPFGHGRFACPTRTGLGPFLIAILVQTLLSEIPDNWELVDGNGRAIGLDSGFFGCEPLDGARSAYGTLRLLEVVHRQSE